MTHLSVILSLSALLIGYTCIAGRKTIIRWLADLSGVTKDVQHETMRDIGGRIYQDHYWFNGGKPGAWMVSNTLKHYGMRLKNLYYPDVSNIRSDVYDVGDRYNENDIHL